MINFSALRHFKTRGLPFNADDREFEFLIIAISLILGLTAGSVIGVFSDRLYTVLQSLPFFTPTDSSASANAEFRGTLLFLFSAALFSTGFLGVVLLPLLTFIRGFTLSCSAAFLFTAQRISGFYFTLFSLGIPALFSIPAFLIFVCSGFRFSQKMLPWRLSKYHISADVNFNLRPLALMLLLLLCELLYCHFLLPVLLNHLN